MAGQLPAAHQQRDVHQLGLGAQPLQAIQSVLGMRGQVEVQVVHVPHHDSDVHLLTGVRGLLGRGASKVSQGDCLTRRSPVRLTSGLSINHV